MPVGDGSGGCRILEQRRGRTRRFGTNRLVLAQNSEAERKTPDLCPALLFPTKAFSEALLVSILHERLGVKWRYRPRDVILRVRDLAHEHHAVRFAGLLHHCKG